MRICYFGTQEGSERLSALKSLGITVFTGDKSRILESEIARATEELGSIPDLIFFQINSKNDGQLMIRASGICKDRGLPLVFCSDAPSEQTVSRLASSFNVYYVRAAIFTLSNAGTARKLKESLVQTLHLSEDAQAA